MSKQSFNDYVQDLKAEVAKQRIATSFLEQGKDSLSEKFKELYTALSHYENVCPFKFELVRDNGFTIKSKSESDTLLHLTTSASEGLLTVLTKSTTKTPNKVQLFYQAYYKFTGKGTDPLNDGRQFIWAAYDAHEERQTGEFFSPNELTEYLLIRFCKMHDISGYEGEV